MSETKKLKAIVDRNLPALEDIYRDVERVNELQGIMMLLNSNPKQEWVRNHPTIKMKDAAGKFVPAKYIPINIVEGLLNWLFPTWSVEVLDYKLIANSVSVHVRLHVEMPNGDTRFYDGIGAAPLQTDQGAGAIEFDKIKSAAVQMALPSAKSYAIKDAADHIGRIFGRDLNREAVEQYSFQIKPQEDMSDDDRDLMEDMYKEIQNCNTAAELSAKGKELASKLKLLKKDNLMPELIKLGTQRKKEVEGGK